MGKTELISAAVAALFSGGITVEAFADAPEAAIFAHFGVAVDNATLDRIGQDFELQLAETRRRQLPGGRNAPNRDRLDRNPNGPSLDGPLIRQPGLINCPPYCCLTCT